MTKAGILTKWDILDQLQESVKKYGKVQLKSVHGKYQLIAGALGDIEGCAAYVERTDKHNYYRTKYYGIAQWFKGITDNEIIDRLTITKRAAREMLKFFPFISLKRIVQATKNIYICEGGLKERELKDKEFCPACQEIIRAGMKTLKDHDLVYFAAMALQYSTSYRCRVQDWAEIITKENLIKHPIKELLWVKEEVMDREKELGKRLKRLFNILILLFILKKEVREFLYELDYDKLKADEDDRYYTLRRQTYEYHGDLLGSRLARAEQIDKERENLILNL